MRKLLTGVLALGIAGAAMAQGDAPDAAIVQKIREEGLKNSKVMDIVFYLTDANGPRLTNSPGYLKAANWAKSKLTEFGLENAQLEPWGEWGKGWELEKSYIAMTAPYYRPMIAFPKTWTSSTKGLQHTEVIIVDAKDSAELQTYKGKLKGKLILIPRNDTLVPSYKPDATRMTDEELQKMEDYKPNPQPGGGRGGFPPRGGRGPGAGLNPAVLRDFVQKEGAVALLSTSPRGRDGTLFVQGGGAYDAKSPENFLDVMLTYEDYMTIQRLVQHSIPVKLDVEVKSKFYTGDLKGYNVVAEIKGTDPSLKEELVMVGGHLDSWHSAMGATDNAAGCAVMIEAVRILKAIGVKPRRTIRIALWGGEEQGLHGSRNYVRNHFTDTATRRYNAEGDKLSVYFNLDNGTGKIRGIYTQGNETIKPIFAQWLTPFKDLGATTVTTQNTGGTDHQSFDGVGLPAFQFIQDVIEYNTRTHHTNMDSYDHLQADDLKQAATIVASFVYNAAQRDAKMPRKPASQQQQGPGGRF
ncbi:MAG: M20/M25/M40 family metallo-hydrolase [Chitinophagaceae bacterium]